MHTLTVCELIHSCTNSMSPQQQVLVVHCMPSRQGSSPLLVLLSPASLRSRLRISLSSAGM